MYYYPKHKRKINHFFFFVLKLCGIFNKVLIFEIMSSIFLLKKGRSGVNRCSKSLKMKFNDIKIVMVNFKFYSIKKSLINTIYGANSVVKSSRVFYSEISNSLQNLFNTNFSSTK